MLSPKDSRRGRLLERYVRVRIVDMTGIDIGLFDYDRHSSIYFFAMSPDEQIYLRYGGRDARAADSYLDLESIALALEAGLTQHERWKRGELPPVERPEPTFPRDIETLRDQEVARGRCVECHMIADYRAAELEEEGVLDKPRDMFRSPDIRDIGIHLDVPKGLEVERVTGAAERAGLSPGDVITSIEGVPVLTFGDLLHLYDRLDRSSTRLRLSVAPGAASAARAVELELELPPLWWVSDLSFRRWSIEPAIGFESEPLSSEDKAALDLPREGFACRVTAVNRRARETGSHELDVGDVVYSVGGVEADAVANSCDLYLRLFTRAGDATELGVIRGTTRSTMPLRTRRQYYRRSAPTRSP